MNPLAWIRGLAASQGLELAGPTSVARRRAFLETLEEWAVAELDPPPGAPLSATGIVFSRDRSLQLHALLESWTENVNGTADLAVLWTASGPGHEASYRELSAIWEGRVGFRRESDFRADLLDLAASQRSSHVFFLTDDAVALRPFDLSACLLPEPSREVFSLTHGRGLDWCFVASRAQAVPPLRERADGTLSWTWKDGGTGTDWAFPLSVDGKFFSRREMSLLLSRLPFSGPNTLEMALQIFLPLFSRRAGVCFPDPVLVNVPCNTVQTECRNPDTGIHSTADLLARWNAGERICHEEFAGLSPRQAETRRFTFGRR